MIIKYILLAAVAYVLWRLFRPIKPPGVQAAQAAPAEALTMVRCAHCGLHLAQAEAIVGDKNLHYCSDAHRALGVGRP